MLNMKTTDLFPVTLEDEEDEEEGSEGGWGTTAGVWVLTKSSHVKHENNRLVSGNFRGRG